MRKIALNYVKTHKEKTGSKLPLLRIMFGCLLDCGKLAHVLMSAENRFPCKGNNTGLTLVSFYAIIG